jgi:RNA binding exosome subunit
MANLTKEDKILLEKQIESRLDDALHFYIRLEKNSLLCDLYEVTDSGNCFHFKISIATYPHSRESAKEIIKEILKFSN